MINVCVPGLIHVACHTAFNHWTAQCLLRALGALLQTVSRCPPAPHVGSVENM